MSETTTIRLRLVRETEKARLYCPYRPIPGETDNNNSCIWVPRSIIEHTTKRGDEHQVKLPDWFIQKAGL